MTRKYDFWKYGQRAQLARMANIRLNHLSEILYRKRSVNKNLALKLQVFSEEILGYPIDWPEWLFNKASKHPAFFGEPTQHKYIRYKFY